MQGVLIHWHRKTSVLGFFRDKTNTHTYVHLSQQTEDPGRPIFQSKSKDWCPSSQSDKRSLLFCHLFVLLRPSNGWTRPTHTGQSHSLCRVHQFSVNFIQKHPQRHSQNHAGPSVWAPQGLFRSHMKSAFTTPASSVEIWLAGCRGPDSIQAWKSTTQNTVCGYKHTNNLCKCTELSESEHRWLITVTFGRVEGRTQNPFFGILGY